MRKARRPCCRSAIVTIAATVAASATATVATARAASATVTAARAASATAMAAAAAAIVARAVRAKALKGVQNNGRHQPDPDPASVPSPPQDLPLLRRQRTEDRLQGRASAAALYFRARQDRAVAHHGGQPEEAA